MARRRRTAAGSRRSARDPRALHERRVVEEARLTGVVTGTDDSGEPGALVVTHGFDPGTDGEPYAATVRFRGRRLRPQGKPLPTDTFVHDESIDRVVPGTGPVSIAAWVYGLEPGEWTVTSELIPTAGEAGGPRTSGQWGTGGVRPIGPVSWSWRRWSLVPGDDGLMKTRGALLAPLASTPAVLPGIYTTLAVVGGIVAIAVQAAILAAENIPVGRSVAVTLLALVLGLVGAKLWYAALHPDEPIIKGGWAVDGFLIVAPIVATVALYSLDLPVGRVLDATAPGLFLAVAIGRIGCFLTGCCAGQCTAGRWTVWSSDRRVGARRLPVQLFESATGLAIGLVSLALVLGLRPPVHGLVFVGAFGVYAVVRQVLLRLRAEQRRSRGSLPLTVGAAALVLVIVAATSIAQPSEKHGPAASRALPIWAVSVSVDRAPAFGELSGNAQIPLT